MKKSTLIFFSLVSICVVAFGNDGWNDPQYSLTQVDSVEQASTNSAAGKGLFDGRKSTAAIYSLFVPGSGQTMLGSPYKGFGITFLAFGSALTTLISHNNFVASNERLDALEFQYKTSTTWESSNNLYTSMNDAYKKLVLYKKTRNTFVIISAIVWTLNIADVLLNTEDEGEVVFSSISITKSPALLAGGIIDYQQRINVSIRLN